MFASSLKGYNDSCGRARLSGLTLNKVNIAAWVLRPLRPQESSRLSWLLSFLGGRPLLSLTLKRKKAPYSKYPKKKCHGIRCHYSFFLLCSLLFGGCVRVYKPVYVPTKCQIPKLERPALGSSLISENIKALLIYAELLEKDLAFCREGKPL